MAESVKVIVRIRPMNKREDDLRCKTVVAIEPAKGVCVGGRDEMSVSVQDNAP
jgi:hypothetical protein